MIAKFEGFSATPYNCQAGVLTVGYGSTIENNVFSQPLIEELDKWDIVTVNTARMVLQQTVDFYMQKCVTHPRWILPSPPVTLESQNQYNALASLAYNIGMNNIIYAKSFHQSVVAFYNGDASSIEHSWLKFIFVRQQPNNGLLQRRNTELKVFLSLDNVVLT